MKTDTANKATKNQHLQDIHNKHTKAVSNVNITLVNINTKIYNQKLMSNDVNE